MNRITIPCTIVLATFAAAATGRAFGSDTTSEPRTEAGVLAADDDWLAAELRGDPVALSARLMPTYRDVTLSGKTFTREDLLSHAAKRPDKVTTPPVQAAAEFRAKYPLVEHVLIEGDTAIVQFESVKPEEKGLILSVDVFTYADGHWRGLYSAHGK
jgi:hypothetical protein